MERTTRTLYCGYIISCALLTCLLNIPFPPQWREDGHSMQRVNARLHVTFISSRCPFSVLFYSCCTAYSIGRMLPHSNP